MSTITEALNPVREFINRYYIDPVIQDSGYNVVNTFTWIALLGIAMYLLLLAMRRLDFTLTRKLVFATAPYFLVASTLRVMEDANLFQPPLNYIFITPFIYLFQGAVIGGLLLTLLILNDHGKIKKHIEIFAVVGIAWFILNLIILALFTKAVNPWIPFASMGIAFGIMGVIFGIGRAFNLGFLQDRLNLSVLFAHVFDGSSTFLGVDYLGYWGKHVVEQNVIRIFSSAFPMIPIKLLVFIPIVYFIYDTFKKETRDETNLKNLVLVVLLSAGISPAVRNAIRMTMGI